MMLPELVEVRLQRRYKRFLADMETADGRVITVHCPNTGAMTGCDRPGSRAWISHTDKPGRKYAWTWEIVEAREGVLVGIHTGRTNGLVAEVVEAGKLPGFGDARLVRREYRPPESASRFDLLLEDGAGRELLVEAKNVTAAGEDGAGFFPDAVSARATKHVTELARLAGPERRVALCFCVQRADVHWVRPAAEVDPDYAAALASAVGRGLEVIALGCRVSPTEIRIDRALGFTFDG